MMHKIYHFYPAFIKDYRLYKDESNTELKPTLLTSNGIR